MPRERRLNRSTIRRVTLSPSLQWMEDPWWQRVVRGRVSYVQEFERMVEIFHTVDKLAYLLEPTNCCTAELAG